MKKSSLKFIVAVLFIAFNSNSLTAQNDITQILNAGLDDAKIIGHAYLEPFGKMVGSSLNGGWYQAAKPHKTLGFNVTLTTSATLTPVDSRSFDVNALGLKTISLKNTQDNMAPTIAGKMEAGPTMKFNNASSAEFDLPQGASLFIMPVPFIQASIGLPFSTEISVRFLPAVNLGKFGNLNMWGVGVKNQFKDFIPGLKSVPIDLSIMLGYTKFSYGYDIDASRNQKLALDASGFTGRILVGKSIPFLSVYAGLGFSKATTSIGLEGDYQVGPPNNKTITDPFILDFPLNSFSANVGARLRFGVFSIHADYTLGKYPLFAGGVGISFR